MLLLAALPLPLVRASTPTATPTETRSAGVLFAEFETVFRLSARLVQELNVRAQNRADAALLIPGGELLAALDTLGGQARTTIFRNSEAVLMGARDFRPPRSLGSSTYQFCYIVLVGNRIRLDLPALLRGSRSEPTPDGPVWQWRARLFEEGAPPTPVYAAGAGEGIILISNSADEIRAVRTRMLDPESSSQILDRIPYWQFISIHQVWGYRHYLGAGPVELIFVADPTTATAILRVIGAHEDDDNFRRLRQSAISLTPVPTQAGLMEARLALSEGDQTLGQLFAIMWSLGFQIYI